MKKSEKSEGFIDTLRYGAIGLSVILLIAGAAFMIPGVQDYFSGGEQGWKIEPIEFETFEKPDAQNNFLVCMEYMCPYSTPDAKPPVYAVGVGKLRENLMGFVDTRHGVDLKSIDLIKRQFDFRIWTQDMSHPDVLTIQLHDLDATASTVAIYSRSPLETNDNGRNKKRVELWLRMLAPIKDQMPPSP